MEQNDSITGFAVPIDPSTTGAGMGQGQTVSSSSSSDTTTTSTETVIWATGIIETSVTGSQNVVGIEATAFANPSSTETEGVSETTSTQADIQPPSSSSSTTTTSTTEIPMIAAMFPNQEILSDLAGSVSTVTAGETIIVLDCLAGMTSPCGGLADPITITTGTSTFDYTAVYESATDGAEIVACAITPRVQIDCTTRYTGQLSDNAITSTTTNGLSSQAGGIAYETITITGGIDLLPTETYITTDYGWIIAYTGSATPTPTGEPEAAGSSSRVWIAGPVVGGLVGLLLIVGAIWFWMRRRKGKRGQKAGGANPTGDMAELEGGGFKVKNVSKLDVNKSELPVREHATAELSAEERRERGMVYELPP